MKKLPQSSVLVPRSGILLLKESVVFNPIGAAEFRPGGVPFDPIMKTVRTIASKLPEDEKLEMFKSWDRLRENVERTSRNRPYLKKMDITSFPKVQVRELPPLMDALAEPVDDLVIQGNIRDEVIEEGIIDEFEENVDIVVYTKSLSQRPWVGRIQEILPGNELAIQWFTRNKKRKQFNALTLPDGSPSIGVVSMDSVMFTDMSEQRTEDSFCLSNYWLEVISAEYKGGCYFVIHFYLFIKR